MSDKILTSYRDYLCIRIPNKFKEFMPYAKAENRMEWKRIPFDLKKKIISEAEKSLEKIHSEDWPTLHASLFHEFSQNGNRVNFENNYFSRRNLLGLMVLAECAEYKGKYIEEIINGIFLICEESGWQLPAHNSYERDKTQYSYADASRPVIDLFACETACLLATIHYLLQKELDKVSPLVCKRIQYELERRIIRPYISQHFWWMGNGDEPMCNWTTWCTQNVLLASFLVPFNYDERRQVVSKSLYSLGCFLKDYGEDGCCSEGAEYYRHAGLCLFNALDVLNTVTGGLTRDIFTAPKIRNIAEFIMNMNIPHSDYFFNFADCSPKAGKSGAREYLFGKATESDELCSFARDQWISSTVEEKLMGLAADSLKGSNIYYELQSIFNSAEISTYKSKNAAKDEKSVYYESNGVYIVNKGEYSFGAKCGNNDDSHNHNDTGSFILYKNQMPVIIDLGVESYTKKTFSKDRYEIWTMQSSFHNLPEINGVMQKDGSKFCAKKVKVGDGHLSMDIASAYPKEAGVSSYARSYDVTDDGVVLHDRYDGESKVVLSFMTCSKPSKCDSAIKIGSSAVIEIKSAESIVDVRFEEIKIADPRLRLAWPDKVYRILVEYKNEFKAVIG